LRTLLIGALAATLVGCSHQPPPRAAMSPRPVPNAFAHLTATRQSELFGSKLATTEGKSDIAGHRDRLAHAHLASTTMKSSVIAANAGTTSRSGLAQVHLQAAHSAAVAARTSIPGPHPIVDAPSTKTIEEQVAAATVVAERMTIATTFAALKANNRGRFAQSKTENGDGAKATTTSANNIDLPVAVLMVRSDIKSVSELTGKTIAVESRYSAYNRSVRAAIVEAGAPEVELSEDQATAISRLVSGEVPAAVLALVSAEAAEDFPEIAGFTIFRVPLSPRFLWEAQ
jgi:ABC-type amino acid transport substrate-binding protein